MSCGRVYWQMTLFRFSLARPLACLLWSAVLVSGIHAANTQPPAADLYQKAVREYVAAAQAEVGGLRARVKKLEDAGVKDGLEKARSGLSQAESLVEQLASAGPGKFDQVKGQYERSRHEVLTALAEIRVPAAPAAAAAGPAKDTPKR